MTTIAFATDSFKGSASATEVTRSIARGWARRRPADNLEVLPFADGGEGTLDAVTIAVDESVRHDITVTGPVDNSIDAHWLELPNESALVELANTSGLLHLPAGLAPLDAHTLGTGEAMRAAINDGITKLIVAIGGSASTDGGVGILQALGVRFLDEHGDPVRPGARYLHDIASIDASNLVPMPTDGLTVWSDVTNPLTGLTGAAHVFGPQKGLRGSQIRYADAGLQNLARVLGSDPNEPGAGAAGGAGYALQWLGARSEAGAQGVASVIGLDAALARADLVVTGEGKFDSQSYSGKAVSHVLTRAETAGVPVALVSGDLEPGVDLSRFVDVRTLVGIADEREDPMRDAITLLERAGESLATSFSTGRAPHQ